MLEVVVAVVVVRLTNCGRGVATGVLAAAPEPAPAPAPLEPPLEPSTVLTLATSCGPGRNTTCPSVIVPVWVSPSEACQRSIASVVPDCHVLLTVICPSANPRLTRLRFSSRMSGPAVSLELRSLYAGVVPLNSTIGLLSTLYSACPGLITCPAAGSHVMVPATRL